MSDGNRPLIIKRKKVIAGGGHHGGAWKVAYADFVTAMMAFFMLMWLLNATTETQRKGLADYFSPTIPVNRISGGGDGAFGGDSVFTEETLARNGTGASANHPTAERAARGASGAPDEDAGAAPLEAVAAALEAARADAASAEAMDQVAVRMSDEGLVIEIFALPERPLFEAAGQAAEATPTATLDSLLRVVADALNGVRNAVAVEAHVPAAAEPLRVDPTWGGSQARAEAARVLLEGAGLARGRTARVTGHAARRPAVADPMAPRNERVELILLREAGRR